MIDRYMLFKETQEIFNMLDEDELPETYSYLESIMCGDDLYADSPYEIASVLVEADKPAVFPGFMIEYITFLYELEIDEGRADAMNDLGALYYDGSRGFEQSFGKALDLYDMAAKKGSRVAQENLGYCYYYGRNVPVDYEKAFQYFCLGAFVGSLTSLYKIGDMYQNGYYVEKNQTEAFHIYNRCLDMMTDEAAPIVAGPVFLRIGNCFLNGNGVEENAKNALICFQKAETWLYDMVAGGDVMYKKSLQAAIDGQAKAREKLAAALPKQEWRHD